MGRNRSASPAGQFWRRKYVGAPLWVLLPAIVAIVGVASWAFFGIAALKSDAATFPRSGVTPAPTRSGIVVEKESQTTVHVPRAGGTLSVLFIGDSVTAGLNASREANGFPERIVSALEESATVSADVHAVSGGTTAEVSALASSIPGTTDLAVVELGTNDSWRGDIDSFTTSYVDLLDRIRASAPRAGIVCLGTMTDSSVAAQIDLVIQAKCEARGGAYRPMSDITAQPRYRTAEGAPTWLGAAADGAHPNNAGHRLLAERVLSALSIRR